MSKFIEFLQFYKYGYIFTLTTAAAWAVVHEVCKYAVKRYLLKIPYNAH